MNKNDIRLERIFRAKELRQWAQRLEEASPALSGYFIEQATLIEDPSRKFDAFGATMMMGKVNGMIAAAAVLMEEWAKYR